MNQSIMKIFNLGKKNGTILFLLLFQVGLSQSKIIFVFDRTTNRPIVNASVTYMNLNEGTFTNSEGKASISLKGSDLKIASLGFEDVILKNEKIFSSDTIFMISTIVQLDEVIIKSFNLRRALDYVIDNYEKLYVNTPFEKECNFKETVLIDHQLKRLILTKVNWWGKTYKFKSSKDFKLRLGKIEYNKNIPLNIFIDDPDANENKRGYIVPHSLINSIYLNTYILNFIKYNQDILTTVENSPVNLIILSFESEWKKLKDVSYRSKGTITFDKESKSILEFITTMEYQNNLQKANITKNPKSVYETKTTTTKLKFYKTTNDLLTLKSFDAIVEGSIKYDNKIYPSVFENSIYVLKETTINKVGNDGLMDLTKPIYKNLPAETIVGVNSIMLNKLESDFIESK